MKYLKELQFIDEIYAKRIPCSNGDSENSITVNEFKTVFQPVRDLLRMHLDIYGKFAVLAENYDEITSCIGSIFIENFPRFEKNYKFLKRYGDLSNIMKKPPFENVYKEYTSSALLNDKHKTAQFQPIEACQFGFRCLQRLSGYTMILERLVKKTDPDHIDHAKLKIAVQQMKHLLSLMNESAKKFELELIHMELVYYLDHCPSLIKSAKYLLHSHVECQSLTCDGKLLKGMHLYLFESCIEVARHKAVSKPMFSPRGSNHPRAMNDAVPIRKMKHIELIDLKLCQQVAYINDERFGQLMSICLKQSGSKKITIRTFKLQPQNLTHEYCQQFHNTIRKFNDKISETNSAAGDELDDCNAFLVERDSFAAFVREWTGTMDSAEIKARKSGSSDLKGNNHQSFNRRISGRFSSLFKVFNPRSIRPSISYQSLEELN